MGNDASWMTVVNVCRGSLVRARVWARGRSKVNMDQYFHGCKHYTSDGFKDCITLSKSEKVNPSCYSFHREGQSPLCHECFIAEEL
jgi:hypothetical protein